MSRRRRDNRDDPEGHRRQQPPPPLADALEAFVQRRGWGRRLDGAKVHDRWEEIAGRQVAEHVQPVRLHGGVLVLRADSSAWATQVRYLTGELLARANDVLGEGQVTSVTVVTGQQRGKADPPPARGPRM